MIVAVASGKGGTGKTTLSVALAQVCSEPIVFLDADVEEPNGHLFLKPEIKAVQRIYLPIPEVDESRCNYCGQCREICRFSAITVIGRTILSFPEMCHGCLGCILVCPEMAIKEGQRELGLVEKGKAGRIAFVQGRLRVGEAMASPLIQAVKTAVEPESFNIIDCPPGTACAAIANKKNTDYCLLVTEDTVFGLHDLQIALEMVKLMDIPTGIIINRSGIGEGRVKEFVLKHQLPLLLEIPHDRRIATACAQGESLISVRPDLAPALKEVLGIIRREKR